jgi:hypothetical protein
MASWNLSFQALSAAVEPTGWVEKVAATLEIPGFPAAFRNGSHPR